MSGQRGRLGLVFAIIGLIFVAALAGGGTLLYGRAQLEPVAASHGEPVTLSVASGESLDSLVHDLDRLGLIKSQFWFSAFARFKGLQDQLHPGQFQLDSGMGASAIIARLEGPPDVKPQTLVLAEGLTAAQMGDKVEAAKLGITKAQYLAAIAHDTFNAPFLSLRPAGNTSLEGFLFPDTYAILPGASAHDVVQMQLDDFGTRIAPLLSKQGGYNSLITASIVEREARFPADFAQVASVINNRLQNGMDLQIDAIVVYGLNKVGQAMSPADEAVDTPYNSYRHPGLPPTPIANPGLATIQAALHPAGTNFLFYVTDGCGHNHYSVTGAEHSQQVQQFLGRPCTP